MHTNNHLHNHRHPPSNPAKYFPPSAYAVYVKTAPRVRPATHCEFYQNCSSDKDKKTEIKMHQTTSIYLLFGVTDYCDTIVLCETRGTNGMD